MDWTPTLILLAIGMAGFAFASWRASRPAVFGKVRLIPWTTLSLIFAVLSLFMLVHVVNLLGFNTGSQNMGFR